MWCKYLCKQLQRSNTQTLGFSVPACLMKAMVGPIFSLLYELWNTANRLLLPCLTYCGHKLVADGCLSVDSSVLITYIVLPTTVLLSHYWVTEAGASGAQGLGLCPSDPPWRLNPHRPTSLLHNGWRTDIGREGGEGMGAGPYYLVIHF